MFFESYDTKYHDNWTGYAIGASYRWYISPFKDRKTSLEGFSFGPLAIISFWDTDGFYYYHNKNKVFYDKHTSTSLSIGGEAAYKWVWGGFSLEPKITLILNAYAHDGRDGNRPLDLNINIGYAW